MVHDECTLEKISSSMLSHLASSSSPSTLERGECESAIGELVALTTLPVSGSRDRSVTCRRRCERFGITRFGGDAEPMALVPSLDEPPSEAGLSEGAGRWATCRARTSLGAVLLDA